MAGLSTTSTSTERLAAQVAEAVAQSAVMDHEEAVHLITPEAVADNRLGGALEMETRGPYWTF